MTAAEVEAVGAAAAAETAYLWLHMLIAVLETADGSNTIPHNDGIPLPDDQSTDKLIVLLMHRCASLLADPLQGPALQQQLPTSFRYWSQATDAFARITAATLFSTVTECIAKILQERAVSFLSALDAPGLQGIQLSAAIIAQSSSCLLAAAKVVSYLRQAQAAGLSQLLVEPAEYMYGVAESFVNTLAAATASKCSHSYHQQLQPALMAAAAALMSFAEFEGRRGSSRPDSVPASMPGNMQLAAVAAQYLRAVAGQPQCRGADGRADESATLWDQGATAALRQVLVWLAEPVSPIATASAVLTAALPALELIAGDDPRARRQLATADGPLGWAPVAAALSRRLPRRMAARFRPDIDSVTSAIAGGGRAGLPAMLPLRNVHSCCSKEASVHVHLCLKFFHAAAYVDLCNACSYSHQQSGPESLHTLLYLQALPVRC